MSIVSVAHQRIAVNCLFSHCFPEAIYPCGESFPVDQIGIDGIKSKTNRRVEIVFFEKGKSAELKAPADKKKVEKKEAAVMTRK